MPFLSDILYKVSLVSTSGNTQMEISQVAFDSRKVKKGSVFVAVPGTRVDGHQYIHQAIEKGAVAVVAERVIPDVPPSITYIQVPDASRALGIIAANFFGNPSARMQVIAVTGTNGKTTTVNLMYQLFTSLGYRCGVLSTIGNRVGDRLIEATHTTPDPVQIQRLMKQMVQSGCTHCFMEASSHAIVQERIAGILLRGAVFMNITHDHLDYHKTFENYIAAKKKLFDDLPAQAFALVNRDDKRGQIMVQNTRASRITFGLKSACDYKAKIISNALQGLELELAGQQVWFKMIGAFNAYNLLAAYAVARELGEPKEEVLTALSDAEGAPGRLQRIMIKDCRVMGIVDYAHTPDALLNVLQSVHGFRQGNEKLVTVVGCGGNRDKEKRPKMATIACEWSDRVIFTSDNPRDEDPEAIIDDMIKGLSPIYKKKMLRIINRKEAIRAACTLVADGDIIVVAGKGHETYQEVKGVKHHFDDREVLAESLKETCL